MSFRTAAVAVLLVVNAVSARGAETGTMEALAREFARALAANDLDAFAPISESILPPRFESVTRLIDRFECISVRSCRIVEETPGTLHLLIDATGIVRGKTHRELPLPAAWALEIGCAGNGWQIRTAETEEHRAVRLLLLDQPIDWMAAYRARPDLDPVAFAKEVSYQASEGGYERTAGRPLEFALMLARSTGDRAAEAYCLSNASWAESTQGRPDRSLELARATVAAAEASNDPDAIAASWFRLGIAQWRGSSDDVLAEACRSLDRAGSFIDAIDEPQIALKGIYMSSYIHRSRGNVRDFLLRNERVVKLARRYGWADGESAALTSMADYHLVTRKYDVAIRYLRAAYDAAVRSDNPGRVGEALYSLAFAQLRSGDSVAAKTLERAEQYRSFIGGSAAVEVALDMGTIFFESGRFAEAEQRLIEARNNAHSILDWRVAGRAATGLSRLRLAQDRPAEALQLAREALAEHDDAPVETIDNSPWPALLAEGKALRAMGDADAALPVLRRAVDVLERTRGSATWDVVSSSRFFEDKMEPYLELIELLLDGGNASEAFAYAERMKARGLRDALEQGLVDRSSLLTAQEKEEERRLNQRLAELNRQMLATPGDTARLPREIDEARTALEQFEARIELTYPAARMPRLQTTSEPARLPQALGDGALVEFVVDERRTYVFVVRPRKGGGVRVTGKVIPIARASLAGRISRLERQIAQRDLEWTRSARSLYDLLLGPVADAIDSRSLLCVVPDGVLWQLPFHMLTRPSGQTLAEHAALFYAPSLAMLQATERHPYGHDGSRTLLAFGNPTVLHEAHERVRALTRDVPLGDLPNAEAEVRAIASLYGRTRSRIYLRDAAREAVFKTEAPGVGVLHLSAHGVFDDHSPMYSAIVLATAAGDADDGLLEAREILGMHIGADLAVLASCDTGKGRIRAGEGLVGMSWAFLVAGCPTTVVSQWPADSRATEMLMIEFHRQLRAGRSPAAALRRAQLAVRADPRYADPLYWAPFIVVGAGMRASPH